MFTSKDNLKLNLGCGQTRPEGWLNLDSSLNSLAQAVPLVGFCIRRFSTKTSYAGVKAIYADLNKRWNYADGSASVVYASHVLEHLSKERAIHFIREAYRVLAVGGIIRIVVPDYYQIAKSYVKHYDSNTSTNIEESLTLLNLHQSATYPSQGSWLKRAIDMIQDYPHQHKYMYDCRSLQKLLLDNGFDDCQHQVYGKSVYLNEIKEVEYTAEGVPSIYVEAKKLK